MSIYDDDLKDIVDSRCRICDYSPCMCGSKKYMSDREYEKEQKRDEKYWEDKGPY